VVIPQTIAQNVTLIIKIPLIYISLIILVLRSVLEDILKKHLIENALNEKQIW
jgi:hypothetical protein